MVLMLAWFWAESEKGERISQLQIIKYAAEIDDEMLAPVPAARGER